MKALSLWKACCAAGNLCEAVLTTISGTGQERDASWEADPSVAGHGGSPWRPALPGAPPATSPARMPEGGDLPPSRWRGRCSPRSSPPP